MKILLVNPTIPYRFNVIELADGEGKKAILKRLLALIGPPLGLNDIAGMLGEDELMILDQKAETDLNSQYDPVEGLSHELIKFKPDIVGFTCLTAQVNSLKNLLDVVRIYSREVLTIIGGIHPTSCPDDFKEHDVDIIALGMSKIRFHQIVEEYKKNGLNSDFSDIPGLILKKGSSFHYTRHLSDLSYEEYRKHCINFDKFPNRKLTDHYEYRHPSTGLKYQYLSTSTGCTHKCNFCYLWKMTDANYFHRSVDSIIDELKTMDDYPIIRFCDANTFGDINKTKELFEKIIENGLNHHHYVADVRCDSVVKHPEILKLACQAGLDVAIIGLEATSDEELQTYNKSSSIRNTEEAIDILNQCGINISGNYIVRPDFSMRDFDRVADFVMTHPIFFSGFTVLTPFPGTDQWEILKSQIINTDYDYYNLANAVLKTTLPEKEFYNQYIRLYQIGSESSKKYQEKYGKKDNFIMK